MAILSIIIPVFNGELYLKKCLDSLLHQWQSDVEIILVNDGSTDKTDQIVKLSYQEEIKNDRLKYFVKNNGGVSSARNFGINNSTGKYIAFVDADDIVYPNYIKTIVHETNNSPDIIEFGYRTINEAGNTTSDERYIHTKFGKNSVASIKRKVFGACLWYPFLRTCKRQLFTHKMFPEGVRFCEDLMTYSTLYTKARTISSLKLPLYLYRINPGGATLNIKKDYSVNLIKFYRKMITESSHEAKLLKINLAYAVRRCNADSHNTFGPLPVDIDRDIKSMILHVTLLRDIRLRFFIYAVFGNLIQKYKNML